MSKELIPPAAECATNRRDLPSESCVYFLVRNGECIYVGQTANLRQRFQTHEHYQQGDQIYFIRVAAESRLSTEREWITRLEPPLNKNGRAFERMAVDYDSLDISCVGPLPWAAREVGVCQRTLYRAVERGDLGGHLGCGCPVVTLEEVRHWKKHKRNHDWSRTKMRRPKSKPRS